MVPEVLKHLSQNVVLLHNSPLIRNGGLFHFVLHLLRLGLQYSCTGVHYIDQPKHFST